MFKGTYTAIVSPFKDGILDLAALKKLVRAQIRAGVDGIVPAGTTGESPALDYDEHIQVIEACVDYAQGKIKVLAGTGANSTSEAIYLTQAAEQVGADGSLQVCPYYNKPSQTGLYHHFKAIADRTSLPVILYSIPGRCVVEIGLDTVCKLAENCNNIVGIKEAGGTPDRVSRLRALIGKEFTILSGDDSLTLPFMAAGADGVVSVASNIIPRQMRQMVEAFAAGDLKYAQKLHHRYFALFRALFIDTNPVPVKGAMAMIGLIEEEFRLPLVPMNSKCREAIKAVLKATKLLKS